LNDVLCAFGLRKQLRAWESAYSAVGKNYKATYLFHRRLAFGLRKQLKRRWIHFSEHGKVFIVLLEGIP
jgi:hypothetical protein